jgi:hypothetical protein
MKKKTKNGQLAYFVPPHHMHLYMNTQIFLLSGSRPMRCSGTGSSANQMKSLCFIEVEPVQFDPILLEN